MAEQDRHSKTEAPTPKRRQEARKKGDVAVSRDLTNGLGLLAASGTFMVLGNSLGEALLEMIRGQLTSIPTGELTTGTIVALARSSFGHLTAVMGGLLLAVSTVHLGSAALQSGFQVSLQPLQPDWNRINPVNGFGRLFSTSSLMRGVLAVIKIMLLIVIVYFTLRQQLSQVSAAALTTVPVVVGLTWQLAVRTTFSVSLALVVAGAVDYAYQRWNHETQLRMTKQEVKDERKEDEGDPMLRARIKRVQREMSQKRMLRDVATATVVLTNPTHYAIALKYDLKSMSAPRVIAKGVDEVALRIREIATENEVPILERRELARALYRTVEVGDEIPPDLYHALAEIVAYLYRIGRFQPNR